MAKQKDVQEEMDEMDVEASVVEDKEEKKKKEDKLSKEEIKIEKIRKVKEEEEKVLDSLKNIKDYKSLVSDCYTELDNYAQMVIKNMSNGLIIEGTGGTGKSHRIINACKSIDFAYLDSYVTPASFYIFMYENRNKEIIVIDDAAGFMNNDKVLALIKAATWAVNGKKIVSYFSTKPLKDSYEELVPSSFEFNSRIIVITNYLQKNNPHIQAVLSRVNYCYVDIPRDELLKILKTISEIPYKTLTQQQRTECFEYLRDNTSESNTDLNIRTLFKMFQFMEYANSIGQKDLWKILANKVLKKDDSLVLVEELEKNDMLTVEEKVIKFEELTHKGRATYFRLKKKLDSKPKVDLAKV